MGLMLELLELFLKKYSLGVVFFFFQICDFKCLAKLWVFAFFLEFALLSLLFPKAITKL
jgi:hypothetical protein